MFCGYLVNFNLNTYQSLKLITILTLLLNNARTLELESQSFIPLASLYDIMHFSYVHNPTNCHSHRHYHPYLYSQCLPTLSPLSLLFFTFFFSILPSGITFPYKSLLVANCIFISQKIYLFCTEFWKFLLCVEAYVQINSYFSVSTLKIIPHVVLRSQLPA